MWDETGEVAITLKVRSATASRSGVDIAGSTVTIVQPGTYRLSGSLEGGRIVVASPGDGIVRLVLDGVEIHSTTTSPLAAMDAGEVMVVLADGSKNVLTDAASYTFADPAVDEPNATLFSAANLTSARRCDPAGERRLDHGDEVLRGPGECGPDLAGGDVRVVSSDDGINAAGGNDGGRALIRKYEKTGR